jgi:IclR family KDG regulon transcriptional repressor
MLVKTLERAFFILNILIEEKKPLGITEISRYSGFSKPTVFRIVQTLESFGFLIRQGSNKYWLGTKILEWSYVISERFDICAVALPIMQKLRDETNETTQLNIRENFERVCVYCLYGTNIKEGTIAESILIGFGLISIKLYFIK